MKPIVILGVFVADTAYRADRLPRMGETLLGQGFHLERVFHHRVLHYTVSLSTSASSAWRANTPFCACWK